MFVCSGCVPSPNDTKMMAMPMLANLGSPAPHQTERDVPFMNLFYSFFPELYVVGRVIEKMRSNFLAKVKTLLLACCTAVWIDRFR